MELRENNVVIETGGQLEEYMFGIDENNQGLLLEMLRSKIYKRPIDAICREISTNSRDATQEEFTNAFNEALENDYKLFSKLRIEIKKYSEVSPVKTDVKRDKKGYVTMQMNTLL